VSQLPTLLYRFACSAGQVLKLSGSHYWNIAVIGQLQQHL